MQIACPHCRRSIPAEDIIIDALVMKGLEPSTFTTTGVGASDQLVPDSNLADRWRNRRVAFFLDK